MQPTSFSIVLLANLMLLVRGSEEGETYLSGANAVGFCSSEWFGLLLLNVQSFRLLPPPRSQMMKWMAALSVDRWHRGSCWSLEKGPVGSPCGLVGCSFLQCWSLGCNLFLLVFSDSFRCLCKKSITVLIVLFIMSQETEAFLNENSADLWGFSRSLSTLTCVGAIPALLLKT